MSKFFSLCKNNRKNYSNQNNFKIMKRQAAKISESWSYCVSCGLILAIIFSVVFYLVRVTSAVTHGFTISVQENQIKDLKLTNQVLKEKVNTLKNLSVLQERALANGLTVAGKVEYLSIKDKGVAVK